MFNSKKCVVLKIYNLLKIKKLICIEAFNWCSLIFYFLLEKVAISCHRNRSRIKYIICTNLFKIIQINIRNKQTWSASPVSCRCPPWWWTWGRSCKPRLWWGRSCSASSPPVPRTAGCCEVSCGRTRRSKSGPRPLC